VLFVKISALDAPIKVLSQLVNRLKNLLGLGDFGLKVF